MTNQDGSTSVVQNTNTTTIETSTFTVSNYTYTVSYLVICNTTENNTGSYTCSGSNGVNGSSLTATSEGFYVTVEGTVFIHVSGLVCGRSGMIFFLFFFSGLVGPVSQRILSPPPPPPPPRQNPLADSASGFCPSSAEYVLSWQKWSYLKVVRRTTFGRYFNHDTWIGNLSRDPLGLVQHLFAIRVSLFRCVGVQLS